MEIKAYKDYTDEEKKILLGHWFNYYGKKIYTSEELHNFTVATEEYPGLLFEIAAMLYYNEVGSTPLLDAMRGNKSELVTLFMKAKETTDEEKEQFRNGFINEVVNTYNNPEPSIPLESSELKRQICELTGKPMDEIRYLDLTNMNDEIESTVEAMSKAKSKKAKKDIANAFLRNIKPQTEVYLNPESVRELLISCMFKDSDIKEEKPIREFTLVEGLVGLFILDTEKINENKQKIKELIDLLPDMSVSKSFVDLCFDRNGRQWTGEQQMMDVLVVLGVAANILKYTLPKEKWKENFDVPVIIATNEDINKRVVGHDPKEYDELMADYEVKTKKEKEEDKSDNLKLALEIFNREYPKMEPVLNLCGYSIIFEESDFYLCHKDGDKICKMVCNPGLANIRLTGRDSEYSIQYSYTYDGNSIYGGSIDRNILSINNLKKLDDDKYSGRSINIELGNGLINANDDPRFEIQIVEPNTPDIITDYKIDKFGMNIGIENSFGPYGNYEDGTHRSVSYSNPFTTPFNKITGLMIHESEVKGNAYYVTIEGYKNEDFRHMLRTFEGNIRGSSKFLSDPIKLDSTLEATINEYLRTPRVKNLYQHILKHMEELIPGIKEYIASNYPLYSNLETIMKHDPEPEYSIVLNDNAITKANIPEDSETVKKELKPNE